MYGSGIWIQLIWGLLDQCFQNVVIMTAAGVVAISRPDWQGPFEMGVSKVPKPVQVELLKDIVIKRSYWKLSWMPICVFFAINLQEGPGRKSILKGEIWVPHSLFRSFFLFSFLLSRTSLYSLKGHWFVYENTEWIISISSESFWSEEWMS